MLDNRELVVVIVIGGSMPSEQNLTHWQRNMQRNLEYFLFNAAESLPTRTTLNLRLTPSPGEMWRL